MKIIYFFLNFFAIAFCISLLVLGKNFPLIEYAIPVWGLQLLFTFLWLDPLETERLRTAIRKHRDQRGDDRCWLDDEELYKTLPEGFVPPERDASVELKNCEKYIACRRNPATTYVSPERRIEELEKQIEELKNAKP